MMQATTSSSAGHGQHLPGESAERLWAVEDCRHVTVRLERALLAAGERVVRVPPHMTARHRRVARTRGKSDPIDALAAARAALAEPGLLVASHDRVSRELRLLLDHRERLVRRRTQATNRLRWHLHNIDPDLHIPGRTLHRPGNLTHIKTRLAEAGDLLEAQLAAELADEIAGLTSRIKALDAELAQRVETARSLSLRHPPRSPARWHLVVWTIVGGM
jgi:transposase